MSGAYTGEIRIFAGSYAPVSWHFCDGASLEIQSYLDLYSLIGRTYGGDGVATFGLPDLRGRLPVGQGAGPGLTNRVLGEAGGESMVSLTEAHLPAHNHVFHASSTPAVTPTLQGGAGLATPKGQVVAYALAGQVKPDSNVKAMAGTSIDDAWGGQQSHINLMPYLSINYIICLKGAYPSFS